MIHDGAYGHQLGIYPDLLTRARQERGRHLPHSIERTARRVRWRWSSRSIPSGSRDSILEFEQFGENNRVVPSWIPSINPTIPPSTMMTLMRNYKPLTYPVDRRDSASIIRYIIKKKSALYPNATRRE